MLIPIYLRSFEKELDKAKSRGLDLALIREVMEKLIHERQLDPKHRNHKLQGNYKGFWECHVQPDWLLIYKKDRERIYFARTGTHSDLF